MGLWCLLDSSEVETTNTSMRLPVALRDAATVAVRELGVAPSTTALTTTALIKEAITPATSRFTPPYGRSVTIAEGGEP